MNHLHINVVNKVAVYQKRDGAIVCGNSDYQIVFSFDSEWEAYDEKTARFIVNGEYTDVDFTGTICPVPIIRNASQIEVGIYAGELRTTTGATIGCKASILCGSTTPSAENDQKYANEAKEAAERAEEAAEMAATYVPKDGEPGSSWLLSDVNTLSSEFDVDISQLKGNGLPKKGDIVLMKDGGVCLITQILENTTVTLSYSGTNIQGGTGETGAQGAKGEKGDKGENGSDYILTDADKTEIVDSVLAVLGGQPVFGYVDKNNNIILSAPLNEEEAYTVSYEMDDGSTVKIGDLSFETELVYTNLADMTSADWSHGRIGSDGKLRTDTTAPVVTNFISVSQGDVVRIGGCSLINKNLGGYDGSKATVFCQKVQANETYYTINEVSDTYTQITITTSAIAYMRFTCENPSDGTIAAVDEDIVITVNEPIK